jgi:hypothetical protein
MPPLHDPTRHEPLILIPWNPAAAQAAIEQIVADTRAAFTPEGLWPIHPDDGPPERGPLGGLYFGAAGVVWALHYLQEEGAAPPGETFAAHLGAIEEHNAKFVAAIGNMAAGYLLAQSGVLLTRWRVERDPAALDRLAALADENTASRALELMWGAPGTMLIALALHEETGEAKWADLFAAGAGALDDAFRPDPRFGAAIWTQEIFGSPIRFLGAVHGFAGNAYVLNRGRHLLAPDAWRAWSDRLPRTLRASAVHDGTVANWPPGQAGAGEEAAQRMLVQHCHGAPGMVTCMAGLDEPIDDLLVAGGELTWLAGPLAKGSNLCHGTGGNGYAFLKLLERTGDELWLGRARAFAMHAIAQSEAQAVQLGRRRYSLATGDLGLACYLWDCIHARARFPTLDVL